MFDQKEVARKSIDKFAEGLKVKMAGIATLGGEPFDIDDVNSMIMAAYILGQENDLLERAKSE